MLQLMWLACRGDHGKHNENKLEVSNPLKLEYGAREIKLQFLSYVERGGLIHSSYGKAQALWSGGDEGLSPSNGFLKLESKLWLLGGVCVCSSSSQEEGFHHS